MDTLTQEIQTAFQAISLILVFVTVFFGLRYSRIQSDLLKEIPAGKQAKKRLRVELWQSLLINCVPLLVVNGAAAYLFLPLLVRTFLESHVKVWDFSFTLTAFVFIGLLVFMFFLWGVYLAMRMTKRIVKI